MSEYCSMASHHTSMYQRERDRDFDHFVAPFSRRNAILHVTTHLQGFVTVEDERFDIKDWGMRLHGDRQQHWINVLVVASALFHLSPRHARPRGGGVSISMFNEGRVVVSLVFFECQHHEK